MSFKANVVKRKEGVYIMSLVGSLDGNAYGECDKQVDSLVLKPAKVLIFDMKELDYIASIGFAVFIKARRVIEEGGGVVALVNLKPSIRKIFDTVKIMPDRLFAGIEEVDEYIKKTFS
ncbi:MAG: STAS domain-containing protein [Candidatus Omnitrophica bacterium]|nr:STAS domain-containing protein [Candidatus Omnitrophota bacterium]